MCGTSSRPPAGPTPASSTWWPWASAARRKPDPERPGRGAAPPLQGRHGSRLGRSGPLLYTGPPTPVRLGFWPLHSRVVGMQIREALTFDDVLLEPGHSAVLPAEAETSTRF